MLQGNGGVHFFFLNILGYFKISQPIMVIFFKRIHFNNIFSQYYNLNLFITLPFSYIYIYIYIYILLLLNIKKKKKKEASLPYGAFRNWSESNGGRCTWSLPGILVFEMRTLRVTHLYFLMLFKVCVIQR